MLTNLKYFGITNVNRIEESIPIIFGDNKAFIQREKDISNIKRIKYINTIFHKITNEF